jgi:hypothetical protein
MVAREGNKGKRGERISSGAPTPSPHFVVSLLPVSMCVVSLVSLISWVRTIEPAEACDESREEEGGK